jgi:hypothetical protein
LRIVRRGLGTVTSSDADVRATVLGRLSSAVDLLRGHARGVYENAGIGVRIPPESVYEIVRNPHAILQPASSTSSAEISRDARTCSKTVSLWKET